MLHGVSREWEVKDRHPLDAEGGVVDFRVAANVNDHLAGAEYPFGFGKLAGGDGSVMHHIMIGASFFNQLAGESERSRRGQ